ncbi:MAG: cell division protein FtsL [Coxiella endosymbiont of Dermacentor nuttalli]
MNTAAINTKTAATRIIFTKNLKRQDHAFQVTKQRILVVSLIIVLLCSAFGVIYIKDLNRRLFIQYQILQSQKFEKLIQYGKLLLEQNTWSTQSRVQRIAQQQLGMQIPTGKKVVLVNEYDTNFTLR